MVVGLSPGARHAVSIAAIVLINLPHKVWGEEAPTYPGVERPLDGGAQGGLVKATLRLFGVEGSPGRGSRPTKAKGDRSPASSSCVSGCRAC